MRRRSAGERHRRAGGVRARRARPQALRARLRPAGGVVARLARHPGLRAARAGARVRARGAAHEQRRSAGQSDHDPRARGRRISAGGVDRRAGSFFEPVLPVMNPVSSAIWAIFAIIWFGLSPITPIFVVLMTALPLIVANVWQGTQAVQADFVEL